MRYLKQDTKGGYFFDPVDHEAINHLRMNTEWQPPESKPYFEYTCYIYISMPPLQFEWDSGNIEKSVAKHGVSNIEA